MIKRFIRKVSYFDTFGAEVKLNFNKKGTHQSPFGGFCTILLVAVLSVIFIRGIISLAKKETFSVTQNEILNLDPPNRQLRSDKFMVAFQADNPLANSTKRLIDYTFSAYERIINENGTHDKNILSKVDLEQCTTDHFIDFDDSTLSNKILKAQLSEYYCLPLDYNLDVQGIYNSDIFLYGQIEVGICQDSDCYSEDEIQQYYVAGQFNSFKISTIILNRVSNLNQENNFITYLYTDFYVQGTIGIKTSTNIFLQEQVLAIDNSFIPGFAEIDKQSIFSVESSKLIPLYEATSDLSKISSFYIRLSQSQIQFQKQFYRFDELISYVGGITKFLATIIGYFLLRYNETGLQIKLANSLYQFDMPEKNKGEQVYSFQRMVSKVIESMKSIDETLKKFRQGAQSVIRMTRVASALRFQSHPTIHNDYKNEELEEIQPVQSSRHQQYGNLASEKSVEIQQESQLNLDQDKKRYLDSLIKLVLESRRKLSFGVHFIVKQITTSFKKNQSENFQAQLFIRSTKMILRDMDILVIMNKLQEIEKIKRVLLNKTQRKVFNYLKKPVVSIENGMLKTLQQDDIDPELLHKKENMIKKNISSKSLLGGRVNFNTLGKFKSLYESYESVALSDSRDDQEVQVNQRLIELVEPTIKHSFDSLVEMEKLSRKNRNNKKRRGPQSKNRVQILDSQQEIGEIAQDDDMDCVTLKGSHSEKNTHRSPQSQSMFQRTIQIKTTNSNRQQQEIKLTKVQSKQDLIDIEICSS